MHRAEVRARGALGGTVAPVERARLKIAFVVAETVSRPFRACGAPNVAVW